MTALVPSYNHAPYLRDRIDSILNQTYRNIDLVVMDDCSADGSHEIISELQAKHGFRYFRNKWNSGTPFASWGRIGALAESDYIWICESDDVAEPTFIETALSHLAKHPGASLFYCNSEVIDEKGLSVGHTDSYFHDIWKESRWDGNFFADGPTELRLFQVRGQTVPNMSSALVDAEAFRKACAPFLERLRLTGDWLFVGEVMRQGGVVFCRDTLNRFRRHESTSRVRVKSARSQAEFVLTKYRLFRRSGLPVASFATLMSSDVQRFLYEPASWFAVVRELLRVSWLDAIGAGALLCMSIFRNGGYIRKFLERYSHAKKWRGRESANQD